MSTTHDTHVSLTVIFNVPEDRTSEEIKKSFYAKAKLQKALYYGFATMGNQMMCREGYKNAEDFSIHVKEVLEKIPSGLDIGPVVVSGPRDELDKMKPHIKARCDVKFAELDSRAATLSGLPASGPDTHVTILPEFTVPDGKMADFQAGFAKFYEGTMAGAGAAGCLYYGFAVAGDRVYCREGYRDAESVLNHLEDVKEPLSEALTIVGESGLRLYLVGPASELDKLRPKLTPIGAIFWELDSSAFCNSDSD